MQIEEVLGAVYSRLNDTFKEIGFEADSPEDIQRGEIPVFTRGNEKFFQYSGTKGKVRLLYSDNKLRLLSGPTDAKSDDDSDYTITATFLCVPEESEIKDIKSTCNDIEETLKENFSPKKLSKRQQNVKAQATVSRSQVKSGASLYDGATYAIRLAAIFPEIKEEYKNHIAYYDEFLCEDFFVNVINPLVQDAIKKNDPAVMKKLFNITNEIYSDGSNEVQDIICVTMFASYDYTEDEYNRVISMMNDDLMEPFIRVNKYLKKSKSARMRLENPPKYKPKKKKKKSAFMQALTGTGNELGS